MTLFATGGVFNDEDGRPSGYVRQLFEALAQRLGDRFDSINGGSFERLQSLMGRARTASHVLWMADVPNDKPKLVNGLQHDGGALCISKNNRRGAYTVDDLVARMARAGAQALIEFRGEGRGIEARLLDARGEERAPWSASIDDLAYALHRWTMATTARPAPIGRGATGRPMVYVEGAGGTVGAMVTRALEQDARLTLLDPVPHRDGWTDERVARLNRADLVIVCAGGAALDEVEPRVRNPHTRLLDVSAARRHAPGWVYALPEIAGARAALQGAMRAANPGCFATAAILCLEPLVRANLVDRDGAFALSGIGGYSTGGRSMVERFQAGGLGADTVYGLGTPHPHVAEIRTACGLVHAPAFFPTVGCFERGMLVQLHLPCTQRLTAARVADALDRAFEGSPTVRRVEDGASRLALDALVGTDRAEVRVVEGDGTVSVLCVLDNLGKGGALAAVRTAGLMLDLGPA